MNACDMCFLRMTMPFKVSVSKMHNITYLVFNTETTLVSIFLELVTQAVSRGCLWEQSYPVALWKLYIRQTPTEWKPTEWKPTCYNTKPVESWAKIGHNVAVLQNIKKTGQLWWYRIERRFQMVLSFKLFEGNPSVWKLKLWKLEWHNNYG